MYKRAEFCLEYHLPFRVLHPNQAQRHYDHVLYQVEGPLSHFAQLYWTMRRDLSEGARITGVTTGLYNYEIKGSGVIVGIMFRPGGIAPFVDSPRALVDRFEPAQRVFRSVDDAFNRRVIASDDETGLDLMREQLLAFEAET